MNTDAMVSGHGITDLKCTFVTESLSKWFEKDLAISEWVILVMQSVTSALKSKILCIADAFYRSVSSQSNHPVNALVHVRLQCRSSHL